MKVELDVDEVIRAIAVWIRAWNARFGRDPGAEDVLHSALLPRLLSGKPLMEKAPPLRFSRPDYELAEGEEVEISEVYDEGDHVVIDRCPHWRRTGDDELMHIPTATVYRIKGKKLKKVQ
jgi:hypothetical protein